jgi:hypothetical protein
VAKNRMMCRADQRSGIGVGKSCQALPATTRIVEERSPADVEKTRTMSARLNVLFTRGRG